MLQSPLLFYLSLTLARLADQMLLFLVPLEVFRQTGSVVWSGAAFFAESLPRYLAFPVCGLWCDRRSALTLLQSSQAWRAALAGLCLAACWYWPHIVWLLLLSAGCGALSSLGQLAREVILAQVFRRHRLEKTLAHAQLGDQSGMILGPLLAASLLSRLP